MCVNNAFFVKSLMATMISCICLPIYWCIIMIYSLVVDLQGELGVDCGGPCSVACPSCSDGKKNQVSTHLGLVLGCCCYMLITK